MRNGFARVLLALATAMTAVVVGPGSTAHAAPVLRIMLAGDSITQGFDGDFTWRYRLYEELTRQQVSFDFVGPHTEPYGGSDTYLVKGWDTDHDAKGGTTLGTQIDNITNVMTTYMPDVVVALYGTNDLHYGASPAELMARWRTYVAKVRAVRPDTTLILGETYSPFATGHTEANVMLHSLADELTTPESPVRVAELDNPGFVLSRDTYDHTHPTPTGETLIAQKVAEALQLQGIVPAAPEIAQTFVPWTPPVRPVVHRVGRSLSIGWKATQHRYRARDIRVRWTNLRTGRTVTRPWSRWQTHLVTPPLRRGTYRVQLQASRRTMTSQWGPAVVQRIRF